MKIDCKLKIENCKFMTIGIDGSRAFLKQRTGIEEYSYQVIKHLRDKFDEHQVVLYVRKNQAIDFTLPTNWRVQIINCARLWTQIGLSVEMFLRPVDVLFIPAHTVPIIHPARNASLFALAISIQKLLKTLGVSTFYNQHSDAGGPKQTIVTIHGLEYEFLPQAYSWWERFYMQLVIKNSCQWASKIISVSENTKKDLLRLYGISESKMEVVYEGVSPMRNYELNANLRTELNTKYKIQNTKYILFIGRLEERKNIVGLIKAFEILKERYGISHKLVLLGRFGFGEENIRAELAKTNCAKDIVLTGFVSEEEKWELLKKADVFLFPTFYEGIGIPILEEQSMGVPVVCSNNSSIPEVVKNSALLVDPMNAEQIADEAHALISDKAKRDDIIEKGYENVKRFSWEKCAEEIAIFLKS